jgi:hypothetical protein
MGGRAKKRLGAQKTGRFASTIRERAGDFEQQVRILFFRK